MNDNSPSRSIRLRKYGYVYNKHLKESKTIKPKKTISRRKTVLKSPPKKKREKKKEEEKSVKKRKLNAYQKFVQKESKKSKYKGMKTVDRMSAIAKEWKSQPKRYKK